MPDTIAEKLARLRAQQQQPQGGQSIEERLAALRAAQPKPGFLENLSIGGQRFLRGVGDTAQAASELVTSTLHGDFRPAKELAELAGRSVAGLAMGGNPSFATPARANAEAMANVNAERQARRESGPDADYWKRSREDIARLNALAAADPSTIGKLTRGGVKLGGDVLTMALAGGANVPEMMASAGVMSLNEPEALPLNVALAGVGGLGARAVPAVERTLGGGAAQAVEREAAPAFAGGLEDVTRAMGAAGQQEAVRSSLGLADQAVEASIAKAAQRSPWQDTVLAYYRSNLLTNPAGRAADLGSTVINQFADAAARPIAAAVDTIVSKLGGERAITGPSLRGSAYAFGSLKQGLKEALDVLRTGRQALESGAEGAVYSGEIRSGLGKVVDVPVNGLFRVMGALDAPFRRFGFSRNLYDRAKVAALNEARQGVIPQGYLTERIRQLLDDPDIIRAAVKDGEAAVLSEPNKISSWLAMQTHNSPNARLAIGLVQPFTRIPLNAVLKAADFSGLGGVKALYKVARGIGRKAGGKSFFRDLEDQRVFSQNIAAGSFAPAAFILGMELEDRGKLQGYYYTSKRDLPNGKVPTSVNIGGTPYDLNRLGGFVAAPMLVGATFNRLRKQNVDQANAFLRAFSALVQTAPALGYYGVPAQAGRILTSDQPGGEILKEAGGIASGFIPASGAAGFAAKAIDSEQKRQAEGFTGPILNRIPGLRGRLPVKGTRRGRR
jgi:hypothetical protein